MEERIKYIAVVVISLIVVAVVTGCQDTAGDGIHVMFRGVPKIHHAEVYHHGRVVGSVLEQSTVEGGASMVTIRVSPDYKKHAGHHWAFYVDMGRLTAGRLNSSGSPLKPGDRVCGFHSKAALNWFKVKTLLGDRISAAGRRADKLHRRFNQSG